MTLVGIIFAAVGFFIGVIFTIIGLFVQGDALFTIMFLGVGGGMGLLFFVMGVAFIVIESRKKQEILNKIQMGEPIYGARILEYQDGQGVYVNGMPPLNLLVECQFRGEYRQFVVETNEHSTKNYPLGGFIDLSVYGNEVLIIPNSVRI